MKISIVRHYRRNAAGELVLVGLEQHRVQDPPRFVVNKRRLALRDAAEARRNAADCAAFEALVDAAQED